MWIRLICLSLLVIVANAHRQNHFLSHLYGKNGDNYVLLCLKAAKGRRARACPGALLGYKWMGVSAGCLKQHPQECMIALRQTPTELCEDVPDEYSTSQARGVRAHFYHPWLDLALVLLNRPYYGLDVHPNSTEWTVPRAFRKHGQWKWIKKAMKITDLEAKKLYKYRRFIAGMMSMRAPLLITVLAIILPTLMFMLVSIYVMFYSGSSKKTYIGLEYNKAKV